MLQSQQPDKRECLYKILVIGELGTGKTSIIKRYVHQFFSQHYRATIGVDFALKVLTWDSNTIIRLQLWDIAGELTSVGVVVSHWTYTKFADVAKLFLVLLMLYLRQKTYAENVFHKDYYRLKWLFSF